MEVIDPGHDYALNWLDGQPPEEDPYTGARADVLTFVKRIGDKYPGNVGQHAGTTMQEVLRALIDHVKYVNAQVPDERNQMAIHHLRYAIWLFEAQAAERHNRKLKASPAMELELLPTCPTCGHIECEGHNNAT